MQFQTVRTQPTYTFQLSNLNKYKDNTKYVPIANVFSGALNNEQRLSSEIFIYGNDNNVEDYHADDGHDDDGHVNEGHDDDAQDDDDLDDVTIATLKQIKTNQIKRLTENSIDTDALNKILHSPSFKVKDLVK